MKGVFKNLNQQDREELLKRLMGDSSTIGDIKDFMHQEDQKIALLKADQLGIVIVSCGDDTELIMRSIAQLMNLIAITESKQETTIAGPDEDWGTLQ